MKLHLTAIAAAACLVAAANPALAQSGPEFKLSGYGTLGVAHSDNRQGDFITDVFQKKGAGLSDSWSFNPDSKLGVQANAKFSDQFSAVLQLVSKQQYDGGYMPLIEWANVKWQPISSLDLRAGRIALPTTLYAESRYVGYSMPWIRTPIEVYTMLAITSNDGADVTYRANIGGMNHTMSAYAGKTTAKLTSGKVKSSSSWGLADSVEVGSWQFRVGYNANDLELQIPDMQGLFTGLQQFAAGAAAVPVPTFQAAAAQARLLADTYKASDIKTKSVAVGATYDPGSWFATSEYVDFKGSRLLPDSKAWYVSAGVRLGTFTPYATYGSLKGETINFSPIPATGSAQLDAGGAALSAGLKALLASTSSTQHTTSVGVRWDAARNVAVKAQFDQIRVGAGSSGRLRMPSGATLTDRSVNVFGAAVDFVF